MNWYRFLIILLVLPAFALPAPAGLFGKRAKPDPNQRVSELIGIAKTEPDERKRASAVEELRQYNPKTYPTVVPVLIEVLQADAKPGVRLQALHTVSSFRPVSQAVGDALENAMATDKSLRVRLQARTTLISYYLGGYRAGKKTEGPAPVLVSPKTSDPPLAQAPTAAVAPPVVNVGPPSSPALAPPVANPTLFSGFARPMPQGTTEPPLVPTTPPALQKTPPPAPEQGPELTPPPF